MTFGARMCVYFKALDCALTYVALQLGATEINYLLSSLFGYFKHEHVLAANFLFVTAIIAFLDHTRFKKWLPLVAELLAAVTFYQAGILIWRVLL